MQVLKKSGKGLDYELKKLSKMEVEACSKNSK